MKILGMVWILIAAFNSHFIPPAQAGDARCPPEIGLLCSSPRVQKLINLQQEIERASAPARSREQLKAQIDTFGRMFDIGLIRGAAIYIAKRNKSLGYAEAARDILAVAVSRSIELFQTLLPVNPSGDGFDILELVGHHHRQGDPKAAGRSLDQFLDYVEGNVPGYQGGLLLGDGARLLGQWDKTSAARAAFDRARRFARGQSARDGEIDYPRFMILVHITQRTLEAGFKDLARATLQEAEALRAREHSDAPDLKNVVVGMRAFIEKRQ